MSEFYLWIRNRLNTFFKKLFLNLFLAQFDIKSKQNFPVGHVKGNESVIVNIAVNIFSTK